MGSNREKYLFGGIGHPKGREVFVRVMRERRKAVYTVALSQLGNAHDAEDVEQEVSNEAW